MAAIDPTTGQPLPPDAIQRVLFVAPKVHVYQIPPLTSTKGYTAAAWTTDPQRHIFTARLRVLETGIDRDDDEEGDDDSTEVVKVDVILEDPATGQLFAAAPYTGADVVEAALDSARFFAVRVQDGQGRKAVLGIGFEERPEAFDFGVALQEARKTADAAAAASSSHTPAAKAKAAEAKRQADAAAKRDYSLKDGETITVNLSASKFGRRALGSHADSSSSSTAASSSSTGGGLSGFSLPPPPPPAGSSSYSSSSASSSASPSSSFALPPPPSAGRRASYRRSIGDPSLLGLSSQPATALPPPPPPPQQQKKSAAELGFDDGQFGEFA